MCHLSDIDSSRIELCVVEAVTNSIEHAYEKQPDGEVEVVFTIYADRFVIDVCDTGKSMDQEILAQKDILSLEIDPDNIDLIPEGGRGKGACPY